MRILLILLLLVSPVYAQNQTLPEAETLDFLSEDGKPIYAEYVEQCRDVKSGKYIKCPKEGENKGLFKRKIQRVCRDSSTGRFIKCPDVKK